MTRWQQLQSPRLGGFALFNKRCLRGPRVRTSLITIRARLICISRLRRDRNLHAGAQFRNVLIATHQFTIYLRCANPHNVCNQNNTQKYTPGLKKYITVSLYSVEISKNVNCFNIRYIFGGMYQVLPSTLSSARMNIKIHVFRSELHDATHNTQLKWKHIPHNRA